MVSIAFLRGRRSSLSYASFYAVYDPTGIAIDVPGVGLELSGTNSCVLPRDSHLSTSERQLS